MEFTEPLEVGFTIYSKSGCQNCNKVKTLLKENNQQFIIVDCDDYIIEDKENFLLFIKERAEKEYNMFPMVFYNRLFVGGYTETKKYIEKEFVNFDDNF